MKIKGKPDVTGFIHGGKAEENPAPIPARGLNEPEKPKPATIAKRQKLVELPEPIFNALKDRAYQDFKATGRRVTETEIIIAALKQYLNV